MAGTFMRSEPAVGFTPPFPQLNPFSGHLTQHAANLQSLFNHYGCQGVLSPKGDKVISLLPAVTVAEYCDIQELDAAIQTQFQDVIANDSSQEIQTNQDTSIITEPISETVSQETVLESKLILPNPKPTIEPKQSSTPAVSKISVIIHANNSVKISPVHDFVEHLDLPKILHTDSNISPTLFEGQIDNPEGPPPLISDSDEDEDFDFRPAIPIQHPVQFIPIHNDASAVKTMVFVDDICIFDRDPHGLFIPATSISMQNIATYLHLNHFWPPPPAITTQLRAVRSEDTMIHHHIFANVETVPSPVHRHRLRHRGETPRSPV
jgi:hypothetical protein